MLTILGKKMMRDWILFESAKISCHRLLADHKEKKKMEGCDCITLIRKSNSTAPSETIWYFMSLAMN